MRQRARLQRLLSKAKVGGRCPACPGIAFFDLAAGEADSWRAPPTCPRCGRSEMAIYVVRRVPRPGESGEAPGERQRSAIQD